MLNKLDLENFQNQEKQCMRLFLGDGRPICLTVFNQFEQMADGVYFIGLINSSCDALGSSTQDFPKSNAQSVTAPISLEQRYSKKVFLFSLHLSLKTLQSLNQQK